MDVLAARVVKNMILRSSLWKVTGHSFLITKTDNVIDLAQNPTYVILDLGCTKSMGSRYAVTRFMKAAHVHGLDF